MADPYHINILINRESGRLLENPAQVTFVSIKMVRYHLQGQRFIIMVDNIGSTFLCLGWVDRGRPGGLMRALRTIPIYVRFAEAIKQNSPDAWIINYTNPMSLCVKTLYLCGPVQAVVETNAVFERDAIRPILAGDLPECVKELIMPAFENHEAILEAALTCNEELVVKAFMNDPQVKGRKCKEQDIRLLVKDMLDGTKKYLPEGWSSYKR